MLPSAFPFHLLSYKLYCQFRKSSSIKSLLFSELFSNFWTIAILTWCLYSHLPPKCISNWLLVFYQDQFFYSKEFPSKLSLVFPQLLYFDSLVVMSVYQSLLRNEYLLVLQVLFSGYWHCWVKEASYGHKSITRRIIWYNNIAITQTNTHIIFFKFRSLYMFLLVLMQ